MNILILTLITNLVSHAYADCTYLTGVREPSSAENAMTDCKMQAELARSPEVQKNHKKLLQKKLAEKVATQIKQSSEELSLLTNFYNSNDKNSLMANEATKTQCTVFAIQKAENCNGKISKNNNAYNAYKEKLDLLKEEFPKIANSPYTEDTLSEKIAGKFYSDLGFRRETKNLQCPLDSGAGAYLHKGQLDEISAENIFKQLSSERTEVQKDLFEEYAQLKMIADTENSDFIKKFKTYVKSKPNNINPKEYISAFFFSDENQTILTKTITDKCKRMNDNIEKFLCEDLTDLASLDNNVSRYLFNKLDVGTPLEDQYEADLTKPGVLVAYGMQCLAKEKNSKKEVGDKNSREIQNVDNWFKEFTKKTREEGSRSDVRGQQTVRLFCSFYTCQDSKIKEQTSCKKGGPVSSNDLEKLFGCTLNPRSNDCTPEMSKSVTFLKNIEKLQRDALDNQAANSSSEKNSNVRKSIGSLPTFAENFLGAEGTLKALGKDPTPTLIAEKRKDIEQKTTSSASLSTTPTVTSASLKAPTASAPQEIQSSTEAPPSDIRPEYNPTQRTAVASTTKIATGSKSDSASKSYKLQPESSDAKESSRLRTEMEEMLKNLKNNPTADAQDIDNNSPVAANDTKPKTGTTTATSLANRAEEDRLKRWENSLRDESRSLDNYRRELDNRSSDRSYGSADEGTSARSAASKAAVGSNAEGANSGSASGSSASSAGASGSSSLKLAATNAKADPKKDTAAILQSGRETSTLSVEELTNLSPDNLRRLGIDSSKPFTLRVSFKQQTYEVPVKSLLYKGNNILGPVIDPKNKDLKDFLMKSPLFKPYLDYRTERGSLIDI